MKREYRGFSKMTEKEVEELIRTCKHAAGEYAAEINVSGLSVGDSFSVYRAISDAIEKEWHRAKVCDSKWRGDDESNDERS